MVNFNISLSPDKVKLDNDLSFIHNRISNTHQHTLLAQQIREFYNVSRWIPTRGTNVQRVLDMVTEMRTRISGIHQADTEDDLNINHHEQYCEILRQGTISLNAENNPSHRQVEENRRREEEAIRLDRAEIEAAIELRASWALPTQKDIRVFKMESPMEAPLLISESFTNYREIVVYLSNMQFVRAPELWVRLHGKHGLTRRGYRWEHVRGREPVESFELDVVDVADRRYYIVAVVHEKAKDEEVPFPLGTEVLQNLDYR